MANHSEPVVVRDILESPRYREPFSAFPADKSLVDVLAYSLMPNHFHIVLRQKSEGGITKFMKKVCVGYSMYFNLSHEHSGVLFQGRFQSKHVDNEAYFRWIFAYTHLNPLDLKFPEWKNTGIEDLSAVRKYMNQYDYSSFLDYKGEDRPQKSILSLREAPEFLREQDDLEELLTSFAENRPLQFAEVGSLQF
ncbi:MAG: transposase [Minisyncoccota bacterium]